MGEVLLHPSRDQAGLLPSVSAVNPPARQCSARAYVVVRNDAESASALTAARRHRAGLSCRRFSRRKNGNTLAKRDPNLWKVVGFMRL